MRSQLDAGSGEGPRPRILFCIDRAEPGSGRISSVFVAGVRTFYTELMQRAGAANAYPDSTSLYPSLSTEGILAVNPDIIVDVTVNSNVTAGRLKADWAGLKIVPAVRRGMVFSIAEPYMTVPGPRIILILEKFRGIVAEYHRAAKNVPASEQQAHAY
jgi:iron complex transport system substrate-binding protein